MFEQFNPSDREDAVLYIGDESILVLKGDNLWVIDSLWDETVLNIVEESDPELLESLHHRLLSMYSRMKERLSLYNQDHVQKGEVQSQKQ